MTPQILSFLEHVAISADNVIEIGAMNVNGTARSVIQHKHWLGTDMRAGRDVDWVVAADKLPTYLGAVFDAVVCCETLEHCEDWRPVFRALVALAKPLTGVVVITVPSPGFPRHDYPGDYWRFTQADLVQ
ncbi:MAG: class I SAM-dependent methyltransferase, partial [Acidobacteriaceae bacterium]